MEEPTPVSDFITRIFYPILSPIFTPMGAFLGGVYEPYATICAVLLFLSGVVLIFSLKKEYVNLDAPGSGWQYDLRIWTVVTIIPYITAYLYFKKW
jgi:hypothetical protein